MGFQISNKAKKVTLGLIGVGLLLLIIGFFFQKEYVFPTVINDHELTVEYWGDFPEQAEGVKEEAIAAMAALGYELEIESAGHGEEHAEETSHGEEHAAEQGGEEEHGEQEHAVHDAPKFLWHIHIKHAEEEGHFVASGHEAAAPSETLAAMFSSGDIAMKDGHFRRFWSNLLVNGFFFFGIALGALFYLTLHYATESGWGVVLLRVMEGIMGALPLGMVILAIVFIGASLGLNHIYPWMDEATVAHDDLIWAKSAYLNKTFFWIRIVAYFGVFLYFMNWFKKTSRKQDGEENVEKSTALHYLMYRRGAMFLVFFAVFSSTMSWDIIMSIDTHWFSTLFGWYSFSGIWLSAMVMIMMITLYLKNTGHLEFVNSSHIHDVGKWMFALSFLWSYLWFSQFMLIWYSNIPEEVIYFVTRIESYKFVFFAMFVINFVLPMIFLMSADTKKSWPYLIVIGLIIFVGHWFDVFCMVMPGTLFEEWDFGLLEVGMFLMFLGAFIFMVLKGLGKASLVQKNHPFLDESKHHHG